MEVSASERLADPVDPDAGSSRLAPVVGSVQSLGLAGFEAEDRTMCNALPDEPRTAIEGLTATSEGLVRSIRRLLDSQQIRATEETAARGKKLLSRPSLACGGGQVLSSRQGTPSQVASRLGGSWSSCSDRTELEMRET